LPGPSIQLLSSIPSFFFRNAGVVKIALLKEFLARPSNSLDCSAKEVQAPHSTAVNNAQNPLAQDLTPNNIRASSKEDRFPKPRNSWPFSANAKPE